MPAASAGHSTVRHRFLLPFSIWLVWGEITTTPPLSHTDFTSRTTWKTNHLLTFSCLGASFYKPGCCAESCKYHAPSLSCTNFFQGAWSRLEVDGAFANGVCGPWVQKAKNWYFPLIASNCRLVFHGFPLSCHFVYILISDVMFNSYYTKHYNTNPSNIT